MKITYDFACQDDCLDKMVPSDLRQLVNERDMLLARTQTAERVEKIFSEAPDLTFDDCLQLFAIEIRNIEAEAGRKGFIAGCLYDNEVHFNDAPFDINIGADMYAAKVRQGGAE